MGIGSRLTNQIDKNMENSKEKREKESYTKVQFVAEIPKYSLSDLILPQSVKDQILDVAEYTRHSKIVYEDWGLEKTHKYSKRMGINLYGPPGTGKTMAAHAIAKHLGRNILAVNYADIESKYVGETPKNIRRAFETAKSSNSVLFFDEADAILSRRVTNMSNATDVSVNQTRSVLLMILNDYQDIIIFATNFIENFDPAFMRRIAKHVRFELPDEMCRRELWAHYIPASMPNSIDVISLSKTYTNLSGSDISNAVLMAAFKAVRNHSFLVSQDCVEDAVKSILDSKRANERNQLKVERRIVSEEYVKEKIQGK